MAEAKDWIFIFPIIVVVLMIVSLFLSVMHVTFDIPLIPLTVEGDLIPIGGGLMDELEPYIGLAPEIETLHTTFFWVGIGFAIFFGLDALLTFINAIRVKTGSKELKKARTKWLSAGISKIISQIILIYVLLTVVTDNLADMGVIFNFVIGWGMIFTFVSGGILIFSYLCAKIAG